jgi:hypothetical protein
MIYYIIILLLSLSVNINAGKNNVIFHNCSQEAISATDSLFKTCLDAFCNVQDEKILKHTKFKSTNDLYTFIHLTDGWAKILSKNKEKICIVIYQSQSNKLQDIIDRIESYLKPEMVVVREIDNE